MKSKLALITLIGIIPLVSVSLTACTNKYNEESTGEYIDSSAITTKVKTKLMADDFLSGAQISVTTYKNVVQLSGFVDNASQKARALKIAREVPGVVRVKDSLEIKQ